MDGEQSKPIKTSSLVSISWRMLKLKLLCAKVSSTSRKLKPHDIGDSPLGNNIDILSHQCSIGDCQEKEPTSVIECDILRDQTANHHNEVSKCLLETMHGSIEFVSNTLTSDNSHEMGSVNLKTENIEGAGISLLLLQKSSSNKWPVHCQHKRLEPRFVITFVFATFPVGPVQPKSSNILRLGTLQTLKCLYKIIELLV
jgi:hypothetical protein